VVPSTSCQPQSQQVISQKAFTLLRLSQLGYPVPDFVVLTAAAYADREHLEEHLVEALSVLETVTLQKLGDRSNPLVFAIRCATSHYIPGVMDTYLNVGMTEITLPSLEKMYGRVPARKMFLNNLRNLCHLLGREDCASLVSAVTPDLSVHEIDRLSEQLSDFLAKTDKRLLEDPFAQALFLARRAYKDFEENLELVVTLCRGAEHFPSLILQKMVCTVRDEESYAGVISSRHTQTGTGVELQTAHNIFGEEMMTGGAEIESTAFDDRKNIKEVFPAVYHFAPHLQELEKEFESPVTIEFAVEATRRFQLFALLQLNETAMAGRAAITAVVDMHKSGTISRRRVTELVRPYHIKQLTSETIDQEVFDKLTPFCGGVSVLPRSAVSARVYFTGATALNAKSRGERVCLCKTTFVPTDTVVMREMDAIISLTSAAIHVVTICHSLGIPGLLSLEKNGVELLPDGRLINPRGRELREGEWITLSSRRHTLYLGEAKFAPGRLLRYMKGEPVQLEEDERRTFASIAYSYRYYQQLTKDLAVDQTSTLSEVTRLVNFDLKRSSEEASQLVNGWFDERETLYTEEVLKSDIGDHLGQSNVFEMLTLDRKIRFFILALAKCSRECISGYQAGAFMLGRFLCMPYPAAFWKAFNPVEIGLLVNEWVLFEKYMQVLHTVGERKVLLARKEILKGGLDQLSLHPGNVRPLITLKLSGARLRDARESLPEWSDPQTAKVLELLQQPYRAFYDFNKTWSVGQLERICQEENLPLPSPDDT
jgi:pyruvate,orthophosphate dikinase